MKPMLFFLVLASTQAFSQEYPESRLKTLTELRSSVETVLPNKTFSFEEHEMIKEYFSGLASLVDDLENYSRYRKKFFRHMRSLGAEEFCRSAYLNKNLWNELQKNCTQNGFFLCSESVKAYPSLKARLKDTADTDIKQGLEKADLCQ